MWGERNGDASGSFSVFFLAITLRKAYSSTERVRSLFLFHGGTCAVDCGYSDFQQLQPLCQSGHYAVTGDSLRCGNLCGALLHAAAVRPAL